jgi:hypothetical protein
VITGSVQLIADGNNALGANIDTELATFAQLFVNLDVRNVLLEGF